jgi:hypothetical protein
MVEFGFSYESTQRSMQVHNNINLCAQFWPTPCYHTYLETRAIGMSTNNIEAIAGFLEHTRTLRKHIQYRHREW